MGGKATLILVLGYSAIILIIGLNMNSISTTAVDNSAGYYENSLAKEIARSGVNFAASNLSRSSSWDPSSSPYSFNGIDNLVISVKDSADIKIVTSTGTHQGKSKTIEVKIAMASFSQYAYFSDVEGDIWWTGADSVWGPFHTNDKIQVKDHPYFAGPTTSHGGTMKYYTNKATDAPTIVGTYSPGTTIEIPTDGITNLAASASAGGCVLNGSEIYVEFKGDSIKFSTTKPKKYKTVLGSDLAPNGIIYAKNADIRIEGTVKGKWSIGSNKNVYIENDIVYSDVPDPMDKYDTSPDLLGIISQNNVLISDNLANKTNIDIHAAIYCEDGSFMAENYDTRAVGSSVNLIGGITQAKRGAMGTFQVDRWTGKVKAISGFKEKNYKYDSRLLRKVPPYFPSTSTFKILSWLE
ncbi:MAG: hypothetical protein WAR79_06965 [Melioribacteraceae bacterium]